MTETDSVIRVYDFLNNPNYFHFYVGVRFEEIDENDFSGQIVDLSPRAEDVYTSLSQDKIGNRGFGQYFIYKPTQEGPREFAYI